MFKIEINLLNEDLSWVAEIRQLNSDILHRHILPKLQDTSYLIDFEFNDRDSTGTILSNTGSTLGHFTVL
ncbi:MULTISPECIES: hypothetical protein [Vibrio]|uniref:Uncharacterized protein n=1 Tax=Vibrio genomosp. F10 str. ZF-129 TaxID=1187848 RepID=A0A1E5BK22_9VIBR|nr:MULTISPECIES: hypothetical protein [Vibrio]OEE38073.1 hypothetical protein A1QO_16545 [Vibrio genomosp. F10 str. ZF-129]OEE94582.1 hypothetical protein A1QK_02725 [Vibrio genomosp. F10 str. 9ZD137]OEE94941.1 hypothetical protein A1QM_05690 [Vibrio genomosp. F10 str. 9ZC157]OEF04179.1 hypothetical protein A1QI_11845 [Vibrio genomosp. F10 str. 9ZB36]WGW01713.1 hypothetical protein QF117_13120 [Vibrio sp. YMD68]